VRADAKGAYIARARGRVEFGPAQTVGRSSWDGGRVVQPVRNTASSLSSLLTGVLSAIIFG